MDTNRLTLYSHGAGCGCKIDPEKLSRILSCAPETSGFERLVVGNKEKDDAAVLDMGDGLGLISTVDFFMPIVDDPYDFGRIAAVNALSDVFAMGGKPLMAIAILGWPVNQLEPELAGEVLRGARDICSGAGLPLAGGHSIDSVEPFFGLSVNGQVKLAQLKRNNGAKPGDLLYVSKPLGVGILTTAEKLERLKEEDKGLALAHMLKINAAGMQLGEMDDVHAMTDVTGFGLLGHLIEMCESSGVTAVLDWERIPVLGKDRLAYYRLMQCVPAATSRNWSSQSTYCSDLTAEQRDILCDPQTSGGLMVAVNPGAKQEFERQFVPEGFVSIGRLTDQGERLVTLEG